MWKCGHRGRGEEEEEQDNVICGQGKKQNHRQSKKDRRIMGKELWDWSRERKGKKEIGQTVKPVKCRGAGIEGRKMDSSH